MPEEFTLADFSAPAEEFSLADFQEPAAPKARTPWGLPAPERRVSGTEYSQPEAAPVQLVDVPQPSPEEWLSLPPEEQRRIIDQLNQAETARQRYEKLQTSAGGTAGREAAGQVGPAMAFAAGFAGGYPLGGGTPLGIIPGVIGGTIAAGAASDLQELAAQSIAPEQYARYKDLIAAGREQHPIAAAAGRLAGNLPAFEAAVPRTIAELGQRAAVGGGLAAIPAVSEGRLPTPAELAEGAVNAAVLGNPRARGLRIPLGAPKPDLAAADARFAVAIREGIAQREAAQAAQAADIVPHLQELNLRKTTTKGEPDASSVKQAAEVYGDVRQQPVEGEGEVPAQEGGGRVQPQAERGIPEVQAAQEPLRDVEPKPKEPSEKAQGQEEAVRETVEQKAPPPEEARGLTLTPVIRAGGRMFTGRSHADAISKATEIGVKSGNAELLEGALDAPHEFLGSDNKVYSRRGGEEIFKLQTGKEVKFPEDGLHSTDLEREGLLEHITEPGEVIPTAKPPEATTINEPVQPSGMAVGIAPPGTEVLHQFFDWTRTLPNKLRGVSAPNTSLASEASGNAVVRFASARMAAPLLEKAYGGKVDPKAFEKAARKELYDQLIADGLAVEQAKGLPAPKIGGKETEAITSPEHRTIWVRKDLAGEIKRSEGGEGPVERAGLIQAANLLNKIQIAGPTDAVWHVANMIGSIAGSQGGKGVIADLARKLPGVNIADAVTRVTASAIKALKDSPDIQKQLAEITRIGAGREAGHEGILGRAIGLIDKAGRLVRDDMYQNLVDRGLVKESEAGRREWINQLGQYNPRLMGQFQRFFRDAGFSPFIVAGRNFNRMAMRRLTLDPGIKAADPGAYWQMKAVEAFGVMATLVAVPSLINYAITGNPNGRPGTKFGQIDTGKDTDDGKHIVIDPGQWNGLRRGLRITGAQSLIEGMRKGESSERITHKAITDILGGMIHPWAGPAVSAPYIAVTGKSPTQYKESENPYDYGENLKTAIKQLNPVIEGLIEGHEKDKQSVSAPLTEVAKGLGGAAGVKTVFPYTANQEIHNAALNFLKKSGQPNLVRKFERSLKEPELSDYQPLRDALRANNTDKAKEELKKLLEARDKKTIAKAMKAYTALPFSGATATEGAFYKSLDAEQKKQYKQAKLDRVAEYKKFLEVLRVKP